MIMSELFRITNALDNQIGLVNEVLSRYITDEVGQNQKEKFKSMTWEDKISLLTNTLISCSSWEDFETDLVINFDYGVY